MTTITSRHSVEQGFIIARAIGIKEIAWLVEDYAAMPIEDAKYRKLGQCIRCHTKHYRAADNLCTGCGQVCLLCRRLVCKNDKQLICPACTRESPDGGAWISALDQKKWNIYEAWYDCRHVPSQFNLMCERQDKAKAAREKAAADKLAAFLAAEDAKPTAQQIRELRASLIAANAIINEQRHRDWQFRQNVAERPTGPYF